MKVEADKFTGNAHKGSHLVPGSKNLSCVRDASGYTQLLGVSYSIKLPSYTKQHELYLCHVHFKELVSMCERHD